MLIRRLLFSVIPLFICFVNDEDISKVLQNGLNGYDGCSDSYIYRKGDDPSSVDQNYGNSLYLMTAS